MSSLTNLEAGHQMYRTREEREEATRQKGGRKTSANWFKEKGYSNTLSIPATRGEELIKQVKTAMGLTSAPMGYKTLLLEEGAMSVKQDMVHSNIHVEEDCRRTNCLICMNRGDKPSRGACRKSGACYQLVCNRDPCTCSTTPTTNTTINKPIPTYAGESSRTSYSRGASHLALYQGTNRDQLQKSWMHRHTMDSHGGVKGPNGGIHDYKMTLLSTHRKPLTRLLTEGVVIKDNEDNPAILSLNSREEYFQAGFIRTNYQSGAQHSYS